MVHKIKGCMEDIRKLRGVEEKDSSPKTQNKCDYTFNFSCAFDVEMMDLNGTLPLKIR